MVIHIYIGFDPRVKVVRYAIESNETRNSEIAALACLDFAMEESAK